MGRAFPIAKAAKNERKKGRRGKEIVRNQKGRERTPRKKEGDPT
jgi:hypothetical protein